MKKDVCKECVRLCASAKTWGEYYDKLWNDSSEWFTDLEAARKRIVVLEEDLAEVGSWFQQMQRKVGERNTEIKSLRAENADLLVLLTEATEDEVEQFLRANYPAMVRQ